MSARDTGESLIYHFYVPIPCVFKLAHLITIMLDYALEVYISAKRAAGETWKSAAFVRILWMGFMRLQHLSWLCNTHTHTHTHTHSLSLSFSLSLSLFLSLSLSLSLTHTHSSVSHFLSLVHIYIYTHSLIHANTFSKIFTALLLWQ